MKCRCQKHRLRNREKNPRDLQYTVFESVNGTKINISW